MFNLVAKRIVNHPSMEAILKGKKTLVNYFTSAGFWRKHLSTWQKTNRVKHGLETLCETCWYSMSKVCLGVQSCEIGFQKCSELLNDPLFNTPTMTPAVVKVIKDCDHFTANQTFISFLKPVVDAIGNLERQQTPLANIWKELLNTYNSIFQLNVFTCFATFKTHCIEFLHAETKVLDEDIYIVAFFLHPAYFHVAV
jgi:hypothetical protein